MIQDPCDGPSAVARGGRMIADRFGQYLLGTGDYRPHTAMDGRLVDVPWTTDPDGRVGSDCAGFAICYCWRIPRHHPGFNHGAWSTVEADVNSNSAIEDGQHAHELFDTLGLTDTPKPGDLLAYPTIRLRGADGMMHTFIGHVGLVELVPPGYTRSQGWRPLVILQCHGPGGFKPGVVRTDGSVWDAHDRSWPKEIHRTQLVRPKERS